MNEEIFDESHAKAMTAIILWAYEHHIDVRFFRRAGYGGNSYPVVRFTYGDKYLEHSFWPLSHTDIYAANAWKEIALKLSVSPPRFL